MRDVYLKYSTDGLERVVVTVLVGIVAFLSKCCSGELYVVTIKR
jgi:hypothetical protein